MVILDPVSVTGAEYFNYFFTIVAMFGMVCFGINLLVRIISRVDMIEADFIFLLGFAGIICGLLFAWAILSQ